VGDATGRSGLWGYFDDDPTSLDIELTIQRLVNYASRMSSDSGLEA
jgi:hypothetical protein